MTPDDTLGIIRDNVQLVIPASLIQIRSPGLIQIRIQTPRELLVISGDVAFSSPMRSRVWLSADSAGRDDQPIEPFRDGGRFAIGVPAGV
jgi:hypothetical protein